MTETPQRDRVHTENLRDYSQLRRSATDRKIAGVAGGLGRHLNIDPTILRVALVVLCFFGGAGFVLYGAAWLLVPEDGQDHAAIGTSGTTRNGLLLAAGIVAALLLIGDSWGGFWFPWPLAVIALILFLVLMNRDRTVHTRTPQAQAPQAQAPQAQAPQARATYDTATYDTATYQTAVDPDAPAPPWTPPAQRAYQPPVPRRDRGPKLFWMTLALLAIAMGSLRLYALYAGPVVDAAYPALALAVVGGMLVLGAWFGRAGGLILLGVGAAIALAITSLAVPRLDGGRVLERHPATAAQVQDSYFVPAGSVRLDLSNVQDVAALDGRSVDVRSNAGEIVVTVPENVSVDVDADVEIAGEADVLGRVDDGADVHIHQERLAGTDAPELELDISLLVGSIEVRQAA